VINRVEEVVPCPFAFIVEFAQNADHLQDNRADLDEGSLWDAAATVVLAHFVEQIDDGLGALVLAEDVNGLREKTPEKLVENY
jgi:hypothetical protein